MMKKAKFALRCVIMIVLILCTLQYPSIPVYAEKEPTVIRVEPTVIRVGVYESNGFLAIDDENKMTGYGTKFMTQLAEYANVKYEYVYLTWSECLKRLLDGGIDIVTDARKSAEREKLYSFSTQCIGQIQGAVFVKADMPDIYFNDYDALSRLKVGFEKNALNKSLYEQYAKLHGYTAKTVEYPSTTELREALEKGEIDAFGGDTHVYTDDLKIVFIYNTDPNYIMAKKDSAVMQKLNLAIEQMYTEHPDMLAEQYSYLVSRQVYGDILLTRKEAEYIRQHRTLRVAVFANRKPASWYDEESGEYHGIAIDVMEKLSEITGFHFEYVRMDNVGYSTDALEREEIDLAMPVIGAEFYNGNVPANITSPLYSLSVAIAYKNGHQLSQDGDICVAITDSNEGIRTMLEAKYPKMRFTVFESAKECLKALRNGKVDAYGNAIYELEYQLKNPRNENLSIAYYYHCPIDYCLAVRKDAPEELLGIIEGGLALLSDSDVDPIIRENSLFLKYEKSLSDRLYENRHFLFGFGVILCFLVAAWLLYTMVQRNALLTMQQKEEKARTAAEKEKRANAAKTDFMARVSHDMRTPMNGILGFAELAKESTDLNEIKEKVNQIESEGKYLLRLINDTLDMGELEQKKLSLTQQSVDISSLFQSIINQARVFAKEYEVQFEIEAKNINQEIVQTDDIRLKQILLYVISNAVKFSPKGGVVEIKGNCYEKNTECAKYRFVIKDFGAGISADFLPKVFEPFEQENRKEDAVRMTGSGLGLSVVKQLVDRMGGKIKVESRLGKGTTVTIDLSFPILQTPDNEKVDRQSDVMLPAGTRVLICEDNEVNTVVLTGCLSKAGCAADCAENGEIGVELFKKSNVGEYDIILMDIRMPIMDGVEATKEIRALLRNDAKTIPIIAVTANTYDDDVKNYFEAGMTDYIEKPVMPKELLSMMRKYIKKPC